MTQSKYFVLLFISAITLFSAVIAEDINIEYRIYSNKNAKTYKTVTPDNLDTFKFKPNLKYIGLCHGWITCIDNNWYEEIIKGFMKHSNYVVIATGYGEAVANELYFPVLKNVPLIGTKIGQLIEAIHVKKKVPIDRFEMVGHSLGAHIAGYAGEYVRNKTGCKIRRIFGLDPALPGFDEPPSGLKKEDSSRTIVFHTSMVGLSEQRGHIDFYPFDGLSQGACGLKHSGDHSTACWYFYCSLVGECDKFVGSSCNHYSEYLLGGCDPAPTAWMSYWISDDAEEGCYYLDPNC